MSPVALLPGFAVEAAAAERGGLQYWAEQMAENAPFPSFRGIFEGLMLTHMPSWIRWCKSAPKWDPTPDRPKRSDIPQEISFGVGFPIGADRDLRKLLIS
jgi:hypothetical protein